MIYCNIWCYRRSCRARWLQYTGEAVRVVAQARGRVWWWVAGWARVRPTTPGPQRTSTGAVDVGVAAVGK